MKIFYLVFLAGLNTAFSQTATQPLQVPKANAPVIDGKLGEDEWKNALKQELVGGGELLLLHDGTFLYVGVHGTSHGWCHLYVTAGDTIFVHHASAALGTATYLLKGELWQPQQTFVWELRERTFTPQAEAARAAYLKSKGWLANNMNTGTQGIIEFKIAQRFLKGEVVSLAVAFASDPAAPQYWPQILADDCRKRELIFGTSPADLKFNRESWAKLELQDNLIYLLPFPVGKSYELIQGNNGPYGHQGHSAYAFDFVMPIGSAVTAAREGIVVKAEGRFVDGNRKPGEENYVFVQHDDSTFARYYHLTQNGPRVKVGDRVARGDTIGLSGNTGASAGPHLHFDVTKGCPEWGCQTVPIVFGNVTENPLQQGKTYKAEPLTKNRELK